jgi:hypothetical protein
MSFGLSFLSGLIDDGISVQGGDGWDETLAVLPGFKFWK